MGFFYNTALAKLISAREKPTAWDFYNTYFSSWWLSRIWFRSLMQNHIHQFDKILSSLEILEKSGILNEDNCNKVTSHANPQVLAQVLISLNDAEILTPDNQDLVRVHPNPKQFALALCNLKKAGILTSDNRAIVAADTHPYKLAKALLHLHKAHILTPDNLNKVYKHPRRSDLVNPLCVLQEASILNQESFSEIIRCTDPRRLARALSDLHRAQILTPENRAIIIQHTSVYGLDIALDALRRAGLLNQENFTTITAPNHIVLIRSPASNEIWERIPQHLLTQDNFQRLLTAAEQENPMQALRRVRGQILGETPQHVPAFNQGQSTHTASVHRSVSDCAIKLKNLYSKDLNIDNTIKEIKTFVNSLNNSPKSLAAKNCIQRITQADYHFIDPVSNVSTRELLALAYTAIHDDSKRFGTLTDAKTLFVEGLYEIQRGYNLNDKGVDQGGDDRPICKAGTFNKPMEKLHGIHQDVFIYFITHVSASSKFPRLSKECALNYLNALASPKTPEDFCQLKKLLSDLKKDKTLEPIWENIKSEVSKLLWDEFSEAYSNNPNHRNYLNLIESGIYVSLTDLDLSTFEKALEASPGCKAYLNDQEQNIGITQHSIFSPEKSIEERSHQYDIRNVV